MRFRTARNPFAVLVSGEAGAGGSTYDLTVKGIGGGTVMRYEIVDAVPGTSVLIGAVAPIPIITPVRRKACDRLSDQLRSFLAGEDMAVAAPATAGVAAAGGEAGRRRACGPIVRDFSAVRDPAGKCRSRGPAASPHPR